MYPSISTSLALLVLAFASTTYATTYGALRVYLDRPWNYVGVDEYVTVTAEQAGATTQVRNCSYPHFESAPVAELDMGYWDASTPLTVHFTWSGDVLPDLFTEIQMYFDSPREEPRTISTGGIFNSTAYFTPVTVDGPSLIPGCDGVGGSVAEPTPAYLQQTFVADFTGTINAVGLGDLTLARATPDGTNGAVMVVSCASTNTSESIYDVQSMVYLSEMVNASTVVTLSTPMVVNAGQSYTISISPMYNPNIRSPASVTTHLVDTTTCTPQPSGPCMQATAETLSSCPTDRAVLFDLYTRNASGCVNECIAASLSTSFNVSCTLGCNSRSPYFINATECAAYACTITGASCAVEGHTAAVYTGCAYTSDVLPGGGSCGNSAQLATILGPWTATYVAVLKFQFASKLNVEQHWPGRTFEGVTYFELNHTV